MPARSTSLSKTRKEPQKMERLKNLLQTPKTIATLSQSSDSDKIALDLCPTCFGTGFEIVEGGARFCECKKARIRAAKLEQIPEEFRSFTLENVVADPKRHKGQAAAIETLRTDPKANYFIAGRFGSGKSLLAWLLFRAAIESDTVAVFTTFAGLIERYKKAMKSDDDLCLTPLRPSDLKTAGKHYAIFLDDIDKARPTEYAAEQLFELLNAIYENRHQLVITTNLSIAKLVEHFDRADERYGGAIVRRLVEKTTRIELFD